MSNLPWFYNIFNPQIFEKERKETMTVYDNNGVATSNAVPTITEKQHMTREDILMICKNALNPYEGGSDAYKQIKQALEERKEGKWIEIAQYADGNHEIECSVCGNHIFDRGHANSYNVKQKYKFCPSCGCRMVGNKE